MTKISLLICGKLRDPQTFESDLERYLQWLSCKAVDRIVFSGWTSDLPQHAEFFRRMAGDRVEVVLSDEPSLKTPGYALHQAKSLHYGLAQFAPEDRILKTRTDKVSWALEFDIADLVSAAERQAEVGPQSPFSERVFVMGALLFQPFFISDQLFLGKARDLQRIANHDLWYECDNSLVNTEQMLYYPAFAGNCPFTRAFFTVNPGLLFQRPALRADVYRYLLGHPLYQFALREFVTALDESFTLGLFGRPVQPPGAVTWEAMLNDKVDVPGTYVPLETGLRYGFSNELVRGLLDIPILEGWGHSLRNLDAREVNLQHLRDDLCQGLFSQWPDLPNVRVPDRHDDGLRMVSPGISLLGWHS